MLQPFLHIGDYDGGGCFHTDLEDEIVGVFQCDWSWWNCRVGIL